MKNKYKLKINTGVMEFYTGYDEKGRSSLFLKFNKEPKVNIVSKTLETNIGKRKDGLWALQISLKNELYIGVFKVLIQDLIDETYLETEQEKAEYKLIERYNQWQKLFDNKLEKKMSLLESQGLLGELFFISEYLIPKYGVEKTIKSWIGPNGANRDFEIEDVWYEIKTKSRNKDTIRVSNEFQLDTEHNGFLVVVDVEKSSEVFLESLSISKLVSKINKLIYNTEIISLFEYRLALLGYIKGSEENFFVIKKYKIYMVDSNFPRIKKEDDDNCILTIKYDLIVSKLEKFKVEDYIYG